MSELENLAARFEADRPHLRQVAQRILGSAHEADDAVQEAWVRLSRSDTAEVDNLTGWLTTVVSRVCLDMLRSRQARREDPAELPVLAAETADPEQEAVMADALGPALLLVLDTLGPRERLAFVLHDMFAVPFPQIAEIIGASPAVARQLASRARRRIQGTDPTEDGQTTRKREIVEAFLAAARGGEFAALLQLLDPSVILSADEAAVAMGNTNALSEGPEAVAGVFNGRAKALRTAYIDGVPGLVWALRGEPKVVFAFAFEDGLITGIEQLADPETLAALEIEFV
ncbi:sigma-70 family RNA polymerase sigma factor [Paractinoplanes globisporus]|uniref:Sigma-70 family RNA polymerase sigma factor n=1 Tax=Paractinoplanes globisporus TaxID=113565 RepID=A0ABW6WGH6_9ACTN|nr:sigma-70 family RNA polymerase sigma factor [Actinoplanes globisporus]